VKFNPNCFLFFTKIAIAPLLPIAINDRAFPLISSYYYTRSRLPSGNAVGLDVGIESFYTDSNGYKEPNLNFLRKGEQKLKKLQRSLSRKFQQSQKSSSKTG